ncbi:ATP-dependent zinc metalloprotease FtsH [Mycoplasmopsis felifaucium]|uniref:ATP-dependent zinc metalloprotease FtsH n=1 Tax=Mycoplasmopsis felifaucium TaxID=35768 RepID=UPI000485C763|nr:ATP-dependent zinc metalloprotease FtsH [Mycoplasmopsis felifaucium]
MDLNQKRAKAIKIVVWTIIASIALILLAVFLYNKFKPEPRIYNVQTLLSNFAEANKSKTDNTYIKNIHINTYYGIVQYIFVNNGKATPVTLSVSANTIRSLTTEIQQAGWNTVGFDLAGTKFEWGALFAGSWQTNAGTVTPGLVEEQLNVINFVEQKTSIWSQLFFAILPTLILFLLMWWLYRGMMKRSMNMMTGGELGEGKNPAQKIKSDKTFKDIAGNKEAIEEISEIVDYLKNPKKYELAGARMPHGILLGGPPGTGKTLLAKATAGEANVPFYFISASNFVEMYVGLGAKRVRTVVEEARKNAPAIIFIDELDAIGRTRGSGIGGGHDEREQTLNQLLVEMDGMKENNGLLFFAATNRTDVLDPALTRPGRFDRSITVGLPDAKERQEILELHAKGKRLSPEVLLSQVAKRTPGYSGAQLENVINEASLLAVRRNSDIIEREDIDEAIDRVMAGPAKKNRVITKEELTMVAYHEAGHAVVGIKMPGANKVQKITIIPRGQAGGYNLMTPEQEKYNLTRKELIAIITSYMGGRVAEEIIYGKENVSTGASDDFQKATKLARKMVTEWGMSSLGPVQYEQDEGSPFLGRDYLKSTQVSAQIAHEIDIEVRKIIMEAELQATKLINENKELHELIKSALLEKETIVAEEIEYIATNMKLPPEKEHKPIEKVMIDLDSLLDEDDAEHIKPTE